MARKLSELVNSVKEYVRKETENDPKKWIMLNTRTISSQWEVPTYLSTRTLAIMRIDPELRYRFVDTVSRFKPREFKISTPESKINDVGRIRQFEFSSEEEQNLIRRLKSYLTEETLKEFYTLMFFCEKMKLKNMDLEWSIIDINEFARTLNISTVDVYTNLSRLQEKGIIYKSPINEMWKLTVTEDSFRELERQYGEVIASSQASIAGSVNPESLDTANDDDELQEIRYLKKLVKSVMTHNSSISRLLIDTLKACDALTVRDKAIQNQRAAFIRFNQIYNEEKENTEKLKKEYEELQAKYDALNRAFDRRTKQIEDSLSMINSNLNSIIEDYFRLPTYQKNDDRVNAKFKTNLLTVFLKGTENIVDLARDKES